MLDKVLFTIGKFEVTILVCILAFLVVVLLVAAFAFRRNYILQVRLSQLMDVESSIHNSQGAIILMRKRRRKILKKARQVSPSIIIVSIDNLGSLYVGYKNKNKLMRQIANTCYEDIKYHELVARIDFNKFCFVVTDRNREEVKKFLIELNEKLNLMEIENYGYYTFFTTCAVLEGAKLDNPKRELEYAVATLDYGIIKDENISYFSVEVEEKVKRLEHMNAIKETALEKNQFAPYIQPKIDFRTGRVIGGEVLCRWVDANQNVLHWPDEFIPLFESNGFINKIDLRMFESCCEIVKMHQNTDHKDIVMSTNFSRLTLSNPKIVEILSDIAIKYQIDPHQVEIEITETNFRQSQSAYAITLMKLRNAGFRVSMDDFGKEYSSLSLLIDTKFDTIKVDKFFFQSNLSTDREKNLAASIIHLLSKVGCEIVLEGIEAIQTIDELATINRNVKLQGYYFSKPITVPRFEQFLDTLFEFDYPEETETVYVPTGIGQNAEGSGEGANGGTGSNTITVNTFGGQGNADVDALKEQIERMRMSFEQQLQEQRDLQQKQSMDALNQRIDDLTRQQMLQQQNQQPVQEQRVIYAKDNRDDEIYRLRREIDELRHQQDLDRDRFGRNRQETIVYDDRYRNNDRGGLDSRAYDELQRQISELRDDAKNSRERDLRRQELENQKLQDTLEKERKEREELEALLARLTSKQEETTTAADAIEEDEDEDFDMDSAFDSLGSNDDAEEEEEDEEETQPLEKPSLSLEEIERIIKEYQAKFKDDWYAHAKEDLKDDYGQIINGLKYYENTKRTFLDKIKKASPELKKIFNLIKNEIMSYNGIVNKLTNSYDAFYMGRSLIGKLSLTKTKVRVFLAVDPKKFPTSHYPHKDVSQKKAHAKTPYYTMCKSQLSVKRIKAVIAEMMKDLNTSSNANYKPIDYATKYKFLKNTKK